MKHKFIAWSVDNRAKILELIMAIKMTPKTNDSQIIPYLQQLHKLSGNNLTQAFEPILKLNMLEETKKEHVLCLLISQYKDEINNINQVLRLLNLSVLYSLTKVATYIKKEFCDICPQINQFNEQHIHELTKTKSPFTSWLALTLNNKLDTLNLNKIIESFYLNLSMPDINQTTHELIQLINKKKSITNTMYMYLNFYGMVFDQNSILQFLNPNIQIVKKQVIQPEIRLLFTKHFIEVALIHGYTQSINHYFKSSMKSELPTLSSQTAEYINKYELKETAVNNRETWIYNIFINLNQRIKKSDLRALIETNQTDKLSSQQLLIWRNHPVIKKYKKDLTDFKNQEGLIRFKVSHHIHQKPLLSLVLIARNYIDLDNILSDSFLRPIYLPNDKVDNFMDHFVEHLNTESCIRLSEKSYDYLHKKIVDKDDGLDVFNRIVVRQKFADVRSSYNYQIMLNMIKNSINKRIEDLPIYFNASLSRLDKNQPKVDFEYCINLTFKICLETQEGYKKLDTILLLLSNYYYIQILQLSQEKANLYEAKFKQHACTDTFDTWRTCRMKSKEQMHWITMIKTTDLKSLSKRFMTEIRYFSETVNTLHICFSKPKISELNGYIVADTNQLREPSKIETQINLLRLGLILDSLPLLNSIDGHKHFESIDTLVNSNISAVKNTIATSIYSDNENSLIWFFNKINQKTLQKILEAKFDQNITFYMAVDEYRETIKEGIKHSYKDHGIILTKKKMNQILMNVQNNEQPILDNEENIIWNTVLVNFRAQWFNASNTQNYMIIPKSIKSNTIFSMIMEISNWKILNRLCLDRGSVLWKELELTQHIIDNTVTITIPSDLIKRLSLNTIEYLCQKLMGPSQKVSSDVLNIIEACLKIQKENSYSPIYIADEGFIQWIASLIIKNSKSSQSLKTIFKLLEFCELILSDSQKICLFNNIKPKTKKNKRLLKIIDFKHKQIEKALLLKSNSNNQAAVENNIETLMKQFDEEPSQLSETKPSSNSPKKKKKKKKKKRRVKKIEDTITTIDAKTTSSTALSGANEHSGEATPTSQINSLSLVASKLNHEENPEDWEEVSPRRNKKKISKKSKQKKKHSSSRGIAPIQRQPRTNPASKLTAPPVVERLNTPIQNLSVLEESRSVKASESEPLPENSKLEDGQVLQTDTVKARALTSQSENLNPANSQVFQTSIMNTSSLDSRSESPRSEDSQEVQISSDSSTNSSVSGHPLENDSTLACDQVETLSSSKQNGDEQELDQGSNVDDADKASVNDSSLNSKGSNAEGINVTDQTVSPVHEPVQFRPKIGDSLFFKRSGQSYAEFIKRYREYLLIQTNDAYYHLDSQDPLTPQELLTGAYQNVCVEWNNGNSYFGDIQNGVPHGQGVFHFERRHVIGPWRQGVSFSCENLLIQGHQGPYPLGAFFYKVEHDGAFSLVPVNRIK
ncbi:hypothetical protein DID75_02550 [Candidatus Marinamargulisbacteria bacterium SCGC AG-410-N11]|nr:hypothetical protein DID75_02550 [Candidatus Marinamargulisbacteria bacterium SCGC AG-410-N11]